jgi:hypothetical protein
MNVILKAIDQEKTKMRQFPVTFADGENFIVIYEFLPEHEIFLSNLVKGILSTAREGVQIFCTPCSMFSEIEDIKKVSIKDDNISLVAAKTA